MAVSVTTTDLPRFLVGKWQAGVGAGIAGVLPMIVYNHVWLGNELFLQFGLIPFSILWGVVYSVVATLDRICRYAREPLSGVLSGIGYSFLVWMGPQIGEPLGQGVFTIGGTLQVVMFGSVFGLVYAYSPEL